MMGEAGSGHRFERNWSSRDAGRGRQMGLRLVENQNGITFFVTLPAVPWFAAVTLPRVQRAGGDEVSK
jgi:hypothetical protein